VPVALGVEAMIPGPAVGGDGERLFGVGGEEALEALGRGIRDRLQPQPAERALPAPLAWIWAGPGLDRARDHCLAGRTAPGFAGPGATHQGFVDLHPLLQGLAVGPDHGAADLVQP
jgi:hypothetical protein